MLDTAIIDYPLSLTTNQLSEWRSISDTQPGEAPENKYTNYKHLENRAALEFIYYPSNPRYPKPRLSIQASLPKVLYGNNIEEITSEAEIEEAIDRVNDFIGGVNWLPAIDFGAGRLWRIDPVYNHQVGSCVPDFLRVLSKRVYPKRDTISYLNEGVQFKSKVASTKFYDKEKESRSSLAAGILRQETTFLHTYYIERRTGLQHPTLRDIKQPLLRKILQEDLDKLHLADCVFVDSSIAQQVLILKYGYTHGNTLFGHLRARQSMNTEWLRLQGANRRTIQKYEKQISDAGVSLALAEDRLSLPPLEIRIPDAPACAKS